MNAIRVTIFIFLIFQLFISLALAKRPFIPWDANVKIADENIKIKENTGHKKRVLRAYNGPQGGAYFLIRFFQIVISPQDGPNCKYRPTCSAYGKSAVLKYGALIGSILAGERLLRCNPYTSPGNNPVPESIFE